MKKLLSLLGVLTISGSAIPTTIAASPYLKQEKLNKYNNLQNLNRSKRSTYSFNFKGANLEINWEPSWFAYWELKLDNNACFVLYNEFINNYDENEKKHSLEDLIYAFKASVTGVGGYVLTSAFGSLSNSFIAAIAARSKKENRGNGVLFKFDTIVLREAKAL